MKKFLSALGLFILGFGHQAAQAQALVHALDVDSSGYEWTALHSDLSQLYISTRPEGGQTTPPTGDIRLRVYPHGYPAGQLNPASHTFRYPGQARVMRMASAGYLYLAGGYNGTTILGSDTLLAQNPFALDPFLAAIDPNSGAVAWTWQRPAPQNNYIHQLRHVADSGQLIASGLGDDVSGWLAAFDAQTGQLLWEKLLPGLRTLSDAAYDPSHPGSLLITGTIDDNGFLNQHPTPVSPPATGYRSFLARYYPANDSALFLESLPYITFDFTPALTKVYKNGSDSYLWTAPFVNNSVSGMAQLQGRQWDDGRDTIAHDMFFLPLECRDCEGGNQYFDFMRYYKTPGFNPNLFNFDMENSPIGHLSMSQGMIGETLGALTAYEFFLAFESAGALAIQGIPSAGRLPDTSFLYANATPTARKWVLFSGGLLPLSIPEQQQLAFEVYPNPVTDGRCTLRLAADAALPLRWSLRDVQGRVLQSGTAEAGLTELALDDWAAGLYLLQLDGPQGRGVKKLLLR